MDPISMIERPDQTEVAALENFAKNEERTSTCSSILNNNKKGLFFSGGSPLIFFLHSINRTSFYGITSLLVPMHHKANVLDFIIIK